MDGAQLRNAQKQTITPRLRAAPHATSCPPAMNFHRLPTSRRDACMYVRAVHKGATACRCVEPRTPSFRARGTQPTGAALKKTRPNENRRVKTPEPRPNVRHSDDMHGPCKAAAAQRKRLPPSSQQAASTSLLRILQAARRHRQHTPHRSAGHIATRLLKQTA